MILSPTENTSQKWKANAVDMNNVEKLRSEEIQDGLLGKESRGGNEEVQDSQHGKRNNHMSRKGFNTTADNIDDPDNPEEMGTWESGEQVQDYEESEATIPELELGFSTTQSSWEVSKTEPGNEEESRSKDFPHNFISGKRTISGTCDKSQNEEPLVGPLTNLAWINLNLDNINFDVETLGEDFPSDFVPTYSISQLSILAGTKCDPSEPPLDPTVALLDRSQKNLDMLQKEICQQYTVLPKTGVALTVDMVKELLTQSGGKLEMYLPGNRLYPDVLRRRINDEDISVITNVLNEDFRIAKINLCYNDIHDAGLAALAAVIENCENIVDVNIMHNNFTAEGLLTLVKHLMRRAPLESLRLTGVKVGDEGIRALACLVLSGRCPRDLDFSECDMTCEGFQAFCSALHAVDNDIDYPHFLLLTNSLPIDLVTLKDAKASLKQGLSNVYDLFESSKMFDMFVAPVTQPDQNDFMNSTPTIPCHPHEKRTVHHLFEAFSATVLEGLIELTHRFESKSTEAQNSSFTEAEFRAEVEEEAQEILQISYVTATDGTVENWTSSENDGCLIRADKDVGKDGDLTIVSKSLYSLDLDENEDCNKSLSNKILNAVPTVNESSPSEKLQESLVLQVDSAADQATAELIEEAVRSNNVCAEDQTRMDISQLLIMNITEALERIGKSSRLTQAEIEQIMDSSLEGTKKLIRQNHLPTSGSGLVCKEIQEVFFKSVAEISQGTFVKLLGNPSILKVLAHQKQSKPDQRQLLGEEPLSENRAFDVAVSFLHGVLLESARLVGTTNPYRGPEDADMYSNAVAGAIECLASLIPKAGFMASKAKERGKMALSLQMNFEKAADEFVIDLFEDIVTMSIGPSGDDRKKPNEIYNSHAKNLARPCRLVMNRPLFGERAAVMASALGEYLATNSSLVSLHLSKWELGEEGMEELMHPMMRNLNLVVLNLSGNNLAGNGMKLLAQYLELNKNLKHLVLRNNPIKNSGMRHLNRVLLASSLNSLDIAHGGISHLEMDNLLRILPKTKITSLYMWGNHFDIHSFILLQCLFVQGILDSQRTDTLVQRTGDDLCVVENKQIRNMNEYYQVPAQDEANMSIAPIYLDTSHRTKTIMENKLE